jgi:SAM-dependent methyltransferase
MHGDQLEGSNFIYRRPGLAERLRLPTAAAHARRWTDLIEEHHTGADSVVDLGCWIGIDTEHLARRYSVVGVDIQPHLIDYARKHRPGVDFRVGDITSIRLNRTFDVVLCVGNSLSYVHDAADLDAAFATFSAHARRGSLLILHTLLAPITGNDPTVTHQVEVQALRATYTDHNEWCPLPHLLTTQRTWQYEDGATEVDVLRRRVLPAPELELRARLAGWDVLGVDCDPPEQAGSTRNAEGCLLATFRGSDDDTATRPARWPPSTPPSAGPAATRHIGPASAPRRARHIPVEQREPHAVG